MPSAFFRLHCGLLVSCAALAAQDDAPNLLEARRGFETKIVRREVHEDPLAVPPGELFEIVHYEGAAGGLQALLGTRPEGTPDGARLPAMVWITGGFPPGGAWDAMWTGETSVDNDQTAQQWRRAGFVMMYPTCRGTFGNPGVQEGFYGEVDDVLAGIEYLRGLDWIDPERIYLGGHSTGGTLALLVAEATDRVRGVVSFGPVVDPLDYGEQHALHDPEVEKENQLRAPVRHLAAIRVPTLVLEGAWGNVEDIEGLREANENPLVRFVEVPACDHFELLAPANRILAERLREQPDLARVTISSGEITKGIIVGRAAMSESNDLFALSIAREAGHDLQQPQRFRFAIRSWDAEVHRVVQNAIGQVARSLDLEVAKAVDGVDDDGDAYQEVVLFGTLRPLPDLDELFRISRKLDALADELDAAYWHWTIR